MSDKLVDVYSKTTAAWAKIFLIAPKTSMTPEELAMLQSLYSRDPASIVKHLDEVAQKGAHKFMSQFFVNYGHKSIGDCGNILLAFEWVSMLAAKAIQDSQLYNGQEASTRYIDFSAQPFLHFADDGSLALSTDDSKGWKVQEDWRTFYLSMLPRVQEHLFAQYPYEPDMVEGTYKRALHARAFDIVRGFLPAGTTTSVAWWSSISHAGEHLSWLRCHVLQEIREIAMLTEELLKEVYPSSFTRNLYPEREEYKKNWYQNYYYLRQLPSEEYSFDIHEWLLQWYKDFLVTRPKWLEMPYQIGECWTITYAQLLDFASYRDQQRHRAVVQRMWLVTADYGFHPWYLNNLPVDAQEEAKAFVDQQVQAARALGLDDFQLQYYLPMGMQIPTQLTGHLWKILYFVELRAQKTVHPTLHKNAFDLASRIENSFEKVLGTQISLYTDSDVGWFTVKRGQQTIFKKEDKA